MRILIAGFEHETNTFAPTKASYDNFVRGEGMPAMARGPEVLRLRAVNLGLGGFLQAAEEGRHEVVPVIWAAASPSAHVTQDAYERIAGEIIAVASRGGFDAIHLDLHGAMVPEHLDDGEGELLGRLREKVGPEMPIFASLDLHANVTQRMLTEATGLVAYRTYPHVDMAETGRKAAALHCAFQCAGSKMHMASRRIPFLIPINGMCTLLDPARAVYQAIDSAEGDDVLSLSFAPGFPAADFPECGPVVWGYALSQEAAESAVESLYQRIVQAEKDWAVPFLEPDQAVAEAMRIAASASRPVVIADTQDNPGAGGDSNTTGMLRALVKARADGAALGLFYDPPAVAAAHKAGQGQSVTLALGGISGIPGDEPFEATFEVEYLSDGRCVFDGPMLHGMAVDLGGVACLKLGGVRVVVSAAKSQMLDRNLFRVGGITPEKMKILVNKSSVHFRADFGPIAEAILVAKSPGPMKADPADLPWTRLAPGMRLRPGGDAFRGDTKDHCGDLG
jgi:microcystin degradation protein MlrC